MSFLSGVIDIMPIFFWLACLYFFFGAAFWLAIFAGVIGVFLADFVTVAAAALFFATFLYDAVSLFPVAAGVTKVPAAVVPAVAE